MFTGDSSGNWLYDALHEFGFASQPKSTSRDDGMQLIDAYLSAAARCAPPDNKPEKNELKSCESFLDEEFEILKNKKVLLALGSIADRALIEMLKRKDIPLPKPLRKFSHGKQLTVGAWTLYSSYHPSRQNTQTGRLTKEMWKTVFREIRELVDD